MNPLENRIEDNIRLGLLSIEDIPKYDYNYCDRKDFYDYLNREFMGDEYFKFIKTQFDESRHYLKKCGRPLDDADRWLIDLHKDTSKRYSKMMTGESIYLNQVRKEFEKTENYRIKVLENYVKQLKSSLIIQE